jgi:hypothetical protein
MKYGVVVQRLEEGNRTEYHFKSLDKAFEFIKESEKKKKSDDGWKVDGEYEIYMPRSYMEPRNG